MFPALTVPVAVFSKQVVNVWGCEMMQVQLFALTCDESCASSDVVCILLELLFLGGSPLHRLV